MSGRPSPCRCPVRGRAARGTGRGIVADTLDPPQGRLRQVIALAVAAGAWTLVFPLAQMLFFGTTDYRRPADVAVIFGARVYATGRPSPLLADRIRTGVELYQSGLVPLLVMSGGDGTDGFNEARVMRDVAVAAGVDPSAILVDPAGNSTEATVADVAALLDSAAGSGIASGAAPSGRDAGHRGQPGLPPAAGAARVRQRRRRRPDRAGRRPRADRRDAAPRRPRDPRVLGLLPAGLPGLTDPKGERPATRPRSVLHHDPAPPGDRPQVRHDSRLALAGFPRAPPGSRSPCPAATAAAMPLELSSKTAARAGGTPSRRVAAR